MKIRRVFGLLVGFVLVLGGVTGCTGWVRSFGGTGFDAGRSLAVDGDGYTYTTGSFEGTVDFDPGPGVTNLTSNGERDAFVVKFDPSGNFVWARSFGGRRFDAASGLAVDGDGYIYTTGSFEATVDFDPGPGVSNLVSGSRDNGFVVKLDSNGDFVWARNIGRTELFVGQFSRGADLAVDGAGSTYAVGTFEGTADFDPGPGVSNLTSNGGWDVFVVKLDPNGEFVWARSMGGRGFTFGDDLAVDGAGSTYVTGSFSGPADFDPGPGVSNLTSNGSDDVFVVKLDPNGEFVWAWSIGAAEWDEGYDLAVDGDGSTYATGRFSGTVDFDPGPGVSNLTSNGGGYDVFVVKLDPDGGLVWARSVGGTGVDEGSSLAFDGDGDIYITGFFQDTADFDPGPGVLNLTSNGGWDAFVLKLDPNGNLMENTSQSIASSATAPVPEN